MAEAVITSPNLDAHSVSPATDIPGKMLKTAAQPGDPVLGSDATPSFRRVLADAMLLLTYSAETGTDVDDTTRTSILAARAIANPDWNYPDAAKVLTALSLRSPPG